MNPRVTIWFAIVMSTVIYLVIAFQLASGEPVDIEQHQSNPSVQVLYGLALASFIAAWFIVPRIVKSNEQTRMIATLAVFESCAIFGLLGALLTKDWRVYLFPWALAILGFIKVFPGVGTQEPPAPM